MGESDEKTCTDKRRVVPLMLWFNLVAVYALVLLIKFSRQWYRAIYDPTAVAMREAAKANGRNMPFNWARGVAAMQLLFVPLEQSLSSLQIWFQSEDEEDIDGALYFVTGFFGVSIWLSVYYQMISRLMISFSNSSYRVPDQRVKQYHGVTCLTLFLMALWGVLNVVLKNEYDELLLAMVGVIVFIALGMISSLTYEFNKRLVNLVVMQCKLQRRTKKQISSRDHSLVRHSTAGNALTSRANPPMPSRLETKTSTATTDDRMGSGSGDMGSPVSTMGAADLIPPVATPLGFDQSDVLMNGEGDDGLLETVDDDDDDDDLIDKEAMAEVERKKRLKEKHLKSNDIALEAAEEQAELNRALSQEAKQNPTIVIPSAAKKEDLGSELVSVGSISTEQPTEQNLNEEPKKKAKHHKKKSSVFRSLILSSPRAKSMSSATSSAWRGGDLNEFETHQQSFLKVVTKYTVIATWVFVSVLFCTVGAALFTTSDCFTYPTIVGYAFYTLSEIILLMTTYLAFTKSDGDYALLCGRVDALYGSMAAAIARSLIERESPDDL